MKTLYKVFPILSICLFFVSSCQGNNSNTDLDSQSELDTPNETSVNIINDVKGQETKRETGYLVLFSPCENLLHT